MRQIEELTVNTEGTTDGKRWNSNDWGGYEGLTHNPSIDRMQDYFFHSGSGQTCPDEVLLINRVHFRSPFKLLAKSQFSPFLIPMNLVKYLMQNV